MPGLFCHRCLAVLESISGQVDVLYEITQRISQRGVPAQCRERTMRVKDVVAAGRCSEISHQTKIYKERDGMEVTHCGRRFGRSSSTLPEASDVKTFTADRSKVVALKGLRVIIPK